MNQVFILKPILCYVSNFCWWHLHPPCVISTQNIIEFLILFFFVKLLWVPLILLWNTPSSCPFFHSLTHSCISGLHYFFTCNSYLTKKDLFTCTLKSTEKLIFMSYGLKNFPRISVYQIECNLFSMPLKVPNKPYSL